MMLQRLATGSTGVELEVLLGGAARHSHAHAQYIHSLSIGISPIAIVCMEGPWHLLFNVRQRMVYMISAEGFAL